MGSDSDMLIMSKAAAILDKLGVEYEMKNYFCTQRTGCVL